MKLTLQTKLLPEPDAEKRLQDAVERFNEAATWLAGFAFAEKITRTFDLHKAAYYELRNKFGLPADMACRCLARVCEAYNGCGKNIIPKFQKHAAVPYSMGKNIGFKGIDRVSISTLHGRVVIPFVMGQYQKDRFSLRKGQCSLLLKNGKWFLMVTVDVPDTPPIQTGDFIGVDMGVVNIIVDSDGNIHQSKAVEAKRVAAFKRRKAIGKKTRGATRKVRKRCHKAILKMGRKESRFRKDVNHQISKKLVKTAQDTGRGIALENLKGIRDRAPFAKRQRARIGSWAFCQLRVFIEYKARISGIAVKIVDSRNTSRTCNACGHCEKANRKSQERFCCVACGHDDLADLNAARNIRARAAVNPPRVAGTLATAG